MIVSFQACGTSVISDSCDFKPTIKEITPEIIPDFETARIVEFNNRLYKKRCYLKK